MKIVLDLAWGSATRVAAQVFQQTGAEVIVIHGTPDGDRINVDCGSTHLGPLKAAVKNPPGRPWLRLRRRRRPGNGRRCRRPGGGWRLHPLLLGGQRLRDQQRPAG